VGREKSNGGESNYQKIELTLGERNRRGAGERNFKARQEDKWKNVGEGVKEGITKKRPRNTIVSLKGGGGGKGRGEGTISGRRGGGITMILLSERGRRPHFKTVHGGKLVWGRVSDVSNRPKRKKKEKKIATGLPG